MQRILEKYMLKTTKEMCFSGFTLTELLVAIAITGIVITVSGSGLISVMRADQRSESESEARMNLNRALDYIADDIRSSKGIYLVPTEISISSVTPGCATATPVIQIERPDLTRILYYVKDLSGCSASDSVWLKPGVIKRVDNFSGTSASDSDGKELVDAIDINASLPDCTDKGSRTGAKGFYACIPTDRRNITLFMYGKLKESSTPNYRVTTTVFARSN
jgi:prepilin-type N-terminal cleavage/methylation domain-containing protein